MSIVPLLVIILIALIIYSAVATYLLWDQESDERGDRIYSDLDERLYNVRKRLNHIKKETPAYIKLDMNEKDR